MELDLQEAKNYFNIGEYLKAIQEVDNVLPKLPLQTKHQGYEIKGCAYFLIMDYNHAHQEFNKAIIDQHQAAEYFINQAATLIALDFPQPAEQFLRNASELTKEPAINFNRITMWANRYYDKAVLQTEKLSQNQRYNPHYDEYKGLVPSFLKEQNKRCATIRRNDRKLEEALMSRFEFSLSGIQDYLGFIKGKVEERKQISQTLGVLCNPLLDRLIHHYSQIISSYKRACSEVRRTNLLQQIVYLIGETIQQIHQSGIGSEQALAAKYAQISRQIDLWREKQFELFRHRNTYDQTIQASSDFISQFEMHGIHITITSTHYYCYMEEQTARALQPHHVLRNLAECSSDFQVYLYNFYWLIQARLLLNCPAGFDLAKFEEIQPVLTHIYSQAGNDSFKIQNFSDALRRIGYKYNEIFRDSSITEQTRQKIFNNCHKFKQHIDEVDEQYTQFILDDKYRKFLVHKGQSQDEAFFRSQNGLEGSLEDLLLQNMFALFYCMDSNQRSHRLLLHAFVILTNKGKNNLNGKQRFMMRYHDNIEKPSKIEQAKRVFNAYFM